MGLFSFGKRRDKTDGTRENAANDRSQPVRDESAETGSPSDILNFIGGQYLRSDTQFDDRRPTDNAVVARVHEASREDVDRAVRAARAAQPAWEALGVEGRAKILNRVADEIMARVEDFARAEVNDTGKLWSQTVKGEIPRGAQQFRVFADVAVKGFDMAAIPTDGPSPATNYPERAAVGVIAAICPWNLPFILMTWKVGPALACGNTVVVKPSEETPASAALLGEAMNAAGVPPGVFNVVHGFGPDSAGAFLVEHPGVDAITFTGETGTGSAIMANAAGAVKEVSLELGGKNAGIIFADCDFERAVGAAAASVFHNCGQVCLSNERLYVERPIFDRFVEALKARAEALRPGDPDDPETSLTPLISLGHREKVLDYFRLAEREGATVVTGGGVPDMPESLSGGAWIQPTIWTGLAESARVVKEEVFGPCVHIQPFDTEDEAVAMVNDNDYGLAATVWSGDAQRGRKVASRLRSGVVWVNCWMVRELRSPFGGFGKSGIGREGGEFSLDFYTEIRNICVNES